MLKFNIIVCFLAVIAFPVKASVDTCYNCDSVSESSCDDPFDKDKQTPVDCSTLPYDIRKTPYSVITSLDSDDKDVSRATVSYGCVKVSLEQGGMSAIVRTCVKMIGQVNKPCDLLEEGTPGVKNCNYCDTNNCNSGALHKVSVALLAFAFVAFFATRF